MIAKLVKRINKSITRIFRFYSQAIYYRKNYKYNFVKFCFFIPVKFVFTLLGGVKFGKSAVRKLGIMESKILRKDGNVFYASNVNFFFEQYLEKIYERLPQFEIKKNMTIIDCGAASGEYTVYALEKGAKLIAFEPDKKAFKNLSLNTEEFKDVKLYNLAVSDKNTKNTITLDKVLEKIKKIDILKIDVEGHEMLLFKGASKTIKKTARIVMEVHGDALYSKCVKLLSRNFKLKRIDDSLDENAQPILYAYRKNKVL